MYTHYYVKYQCNSTQATSNCGCIVTCINVCACIHWYSSIHSVNQMSSAAVNSLNTCTCMGTTARYCSCMIDLETLQHNTIQHKS